MPDQSSLAAFLSMSNQPSSLAFLSLPNLHRSHNKAQLVFGNLPTSINNARITLHGPFDIWIPIDHCLEGRLLQPIYNQNSKGITWIVNTLQGSDPDGNEPRLMWNSSVFRIDPSFTLKSAEHIKVPYQGGPEQTCLPATGVAPMAEDGSVSASCLNQDGGVGIVQKVGDSWKTIPIQAPFDLHYQQGPQHSELLHHSSPWHSTVYHISTPWNQPHESNYYLLDTIPTSMFSALHSDDTLLWRRFKVNISTNVKGAQPRSVCTLDHSNKKSWLCTFFLTEDLKIVAEYLRLRQDGTVATNHSMIYSTRSDTLVLDRAEKNNASDLCVVHWEDCLLLTWNQNGRAKGKIGLKTENGLPQKLSAWRPVKFEFDTAEGRISDCGVIVPSDFCGWEESDKKFYPKET